MAAVLKTAELARGPGVRIPSPPLIVRVTPGVPERAGIADVLAELPEVALERPHGHETGHRVPMAAIAHDLVDKPLHAPKEHRAGRLQRLQSLGRQDHPHLSTVPMGFPSSHDEAKLLERADHATDHRGGDSKAPADHALAHLDRALDDTRLASPRADGVKQVKPRGRQANRRKGPTGNPQEPMEGPLHAQCDLVHTRCPRAAAVPTPTARVTRAPLARSTVSSPSPFYPRKARDHAHAYDLGFWRVSGPQMRRASRLALSRTDCEVSRDGRRERRGRNAREGRWRSARLRAACRGIAQGSVEYPVLFHSPLADAF